MEENFVENTFENMPPVQEDPPKKRLWQKLNEQQYYSKSYEDFNKQFSSPEKIQKLYDVLNKKRYYTKSLNDFNRDYFAPPAPNVSQQSATDPVKISEKSFAEEKSTTQQSLPTGTGNTPLSSQNKTAVPNAINEKKVDNSELVKSLIKDNLVDFSKYAAPNKSFGTKSDDARPSHEIQFSKFESEAKKLLQQKYPDAAVRVDFKRGNNLYNDQGGRSIKSQAAIMANGNSQTPVSLHNFNSARDYDLFVDGKIVDPDKNKQLYKDVLWSASKATGLHHLEDWDVAHISLVEEGKGTALQQIKEKYRDILDTPEAQNTIKYLTENADKNPKYREILDSLNGIIHEAEVSDPMMSSSIDGGLRAPEDYKSEWGTGDGGVRYYKPTTGQIAEFGGIERLKSNFAVNYPDARLLGEDGKVLVEASEANPLNTEPSFAERMGNAVLSILPSMQNTIASIPEFIYNFPATFGNLLASAVENNAGQNEYSDLLKTKGNPYQEMISLTTSDQDTDWNYVNPFYALDQFSKQGKNAADYYNSRNQFKHEGIYDAMKSGDYGEAGEQLAVGIVHAVPFVLQMMATEGVSAAGNLGIASKAALSSVPFMNMHYQELKDREDLSYNQKMGMSAIAGFTDYTLGAALGTQKLVRETLFKSMSQEEIAKMSSGFVNKLLYSNGIVPATMRGGITLATNTLANNITKGNDPMEGVVDSFILGSTMDFGMAAAPKIGSYFKDKSASKKVEVLDAEVKDLQRDLQQPDILPELSDIIQQKLEEKTKEMSEIIDANVSDAATLTNEQRQRIDAIDKRTQGITALLESPNAEKLYSETAINAYKNELVNLQKQRDQVLNENINEGGKVSDSEPGRKKSIEVDENIEADEWDALMAGGAEKFRTDGKKTVNGVEYVRQEPIADAPVGKSDQVKFADGVDVPFDYVLVDASKLQPAHSNGVRNNSHFIPEAQPKNRKDAASLKSSDEIAAKINVRELGENTNAYSGAPIINERGEVIQGNNRSDAIRKHYESGRDKYKNALANAAEQFGLTKEQVEAMDRPVLARRVKASDADAITLGNYEFKDIESGGSARINPVNVSRRMPRADKARLVDAVFGGNTEMTINEAMRVNGKKVVEVLKPYLSDTQKASLFKQNGEFRPEAVKDMEGLVTNFLFEGADVSISDAYDALPSRTQQGINRSLPKLLSLPAAKTIIPELQRAIGIVAQYKKSGVESFESWANQADMFAGGKSPKTQFGEVEMLLAKLLSDAKTPKNIYNALGKYANKVSPNEGDMFTPKTDGESKESGIKDLQENVNEETRKPIEQASTANGSDSRSRGGRNAGKGDGGADLFTDGSGNNGRVEPSGIYEQSQGGTVQDRKNNLTSERVKPELSTSTEKPRKLNEISGDLVDGLNATVLHAKGGRRGVLGSYRSSDTLVKISKAGDVDTMAHEVGHLLDDRYDIFGKIPASDRSKIYNELQWFADRGGSNPSGRMSDAQKIEYLKREGIAEYFRAKIANPKEAANRAPLFDQHFEKMVYGDAEVKQVLDNFSKEYINLANSSNGELMSANIENSALPDKKGFRDWLQKNFPTKKEGIFQINAFDRLKVNFTNSMAIANKAFRFAVNELGDGKPLPIHKQFDIVARDFAGEGGKINWLMERGLHDADNKLIKGSDGKAMNVEWLIKDLDSSSPEALHGEMDDVIRLLIAERTVEYSNKFERDNNLSGIGAGLKKDLDVASGHLMDFEKLKGTDKEKYDRIRKAADKYREYADATLRYAVDKGRISEADYQAISDNNQFYVSMKRIKESSPLEEQLGYISKSGGSLGSVREVLHTAKGGSDMISNPYQSLLMNMANIVREADRNEVISIFMEPLTKKRAMGDGDAINYAQIAHEVNSQSGLDRIIEYYDKGEKKRWRIADKDVFSALKNLEGISDGPIWKALAFPAKVIRSTVTNFPVFAARNATRDTIARLIHSRTNSGLKDFLGTKPYEDAFHLYGGSQAGFHLIDKLDYSRKLNDTVKEITKKGGIVLDPRKILSGYKSFLEKAENVNRMAEFKSAYEKAIAEGMSERDAGLYAAYQARDLMDFAVAGNFIRKVNQIIPFTNAAVQGLVRTAKIAKEQPGGFALRTALYTIVPTLITRSMVMMMGDDEEYKQLPDYQRDLFWNFKVPGINSWFSIPKPFELGLASSFVDRSLDMTTGSEAKQAYSGLGNAGFDAMIPFDRNSLMGSARPLIEAMTNKDTFRDTYIVPQYEEGKDMELRKGANKASRLGKGLSSAFSLVDDVDPRKVDHVIKGYTTYVGDWAMTLSDIGRNDSRNKFGVSKTGFMKETPISSSKSVSEFFNVAKRKGKERSREVKYIHSLIQDYYDAQSEVKRKKIAETIWRESDKYRKVFEALKNSD